MRNPLKACSCTSNKQLKDDEEKINSRFSSSTEPKPTSVGTRRSSKRVNHDNERNENTLVQSPVSTSPIEPERVTSPPLDDATVSHVLRETRGQPGPVVRGLNEPQPLYGGYGMEKAPRSSLSKERKEPYARDETTNGYQAGMSNDAERLARRSNEDVRAGKQRQTKIIGDNDNSVQTASTGHFAREQQPLLHRDHETNSSRIDGAPVTAVLIPARDVIDHDHHPSYYPTQDVPSNQYGTSQEAQPSNTQSTKPQTHTRAYSASRYISDAGLSATSSMYSAHNAQDTSEGLTRAQEKSRHYDNDANDVSPIDGQIENYPIVVASPARKPVFNGQVEGVPVEDETYTTESRPSDPGWPLTQHTTDPEDTQHYQGTREVVSEGPLSTALAEKYGQLEDKHSTTVHIHKEETKVNAPVIHEKIQRHVHEEITTEIRRDIHTHEVRVHVQPLLDTQTLPDRHWIQDDNGELIEITQSMVESLKLHEGYREVERYVERTDYEGRRSMHVMGEGGKLLPIAT